MTHKKAEYLERINAKCTQLKLTPPLDALYVSLKQQKLHYFNADQWRKTYAISTSKRTPSNEENSFGTPSGLHRIAKKIGADAPMGTVFKGRLSTGRSYSELSPSERQNNLITTRILWLEGLEEGVNKGNGIDTFERYIYIHGTNHEDEIGQPQSKGCILLTNHDIIELYNYIQEGAHVLIE